MTERLATAALELTTDQTQFNQGLADAEKRVKATFAGAAKDLEAFGKQTTDAGKALSVGLTAPILAGAGAVLAAGVTIDGALDTIRTGTGATGAALKDLEGSFRAVFKGVPNSAEEVSTAIADINTRTGLTGKPLEALTTQLLTLARVSNSEVGPLIASSTRVFGDWSIATDQQAGSLDFLWKTSQSTGISVSTLQEKIVQFGAPLRQLGFSFEESAAMLGKWERDGVNTEKVLGSLTIGVGKLAKEGVSSADMAHVFRERLEAIRTSATPVTDAIALFGAKAGPDMAAAITEGRLSIGDLMSTLHASDETIAKAAAETDDFAEKWKTVKNNLILALEPLGVRMMDALDKLTPVLMQVVGAVTKLVEWFGDMSPAAQTVALVLAGIGAAIGPVLIVVGSLASAVAAILPWFAAGTTGATVLGTAFTVLTGPIGIAAAAIAGLALVWFKWGDDIKRIVSEAIGVIKSNFNAAIGFAKAMYEGIKGWLLDKFTAVVDGIKAKVAAVTGFFGTMYDKVVGNSYVPDMVNRIAEEMARLRTVMVAPALSATTLTADAFKNMGTSIDIGALAPATGKFSGFIDAIKQGITGGNGIKGLLGPVMQGITSNFGSGWGTVFQAGTAVARAFAGDFSGVVQLVSQHFDKVVKFIGEGIKKIGSWFKGLFGGASAKELGGREVAGAFRDTVASMMNERQKVEAGNDEWKKSVIVVRDAYLAMGKTEAEALAAMDRLWKAEKEGAGAVEEAIKPIQAALDFVKTKSEETGLSLDELRAKGMEAGNTVATSIADAGRQLDVVGEAGESLAERLKESLGGLKFDIPIGMGAGGGLELPAIPMADGGFGRVTRPTLFLAGEKGGEDFAFSGAGESFGAGGGSPDWSRAVVHLDGRKVGFALVPHLPAAAGAFA